MVHAYRAARARLNAALDALTMGFEGLYQIWFSFKEQGDPDFGRRHMNGS